jgi:hypothetical protein
MLYVRDHIEVPRDMNIWAAKRLRQELTETAKMIGVDVSTWADERRVAQAEKIIKDKLEEVEEGVEKLVTTFDQYIELK